MMCFAGLLIILDGIEFIQQRLHSVVFEKTVFIHLFFDIRHQLQSNKLYEEFSLEIHNYENDRIDIKSSVIAELAEALQTDPNYLILGEKTPEADNRFVNEAENRFVNEAAELFSKITDPKVQEMLLKQIRALV